MSLMICEALDFSLSQPRATLFAGILAVCGALIALYGVHRNIQGQQIAERRKRRVDQVLEAASEMYTAANRMLAHNGPPNAEWHSISHDASTALARLELLGFEEASEKGKDVIAVLRDAAKSDTGRTPEFEQKFAESVGTAMASFKEAVQQAETDKYK